MKTSRIAMLALTAISVAVPAIAHHSFADYDDKKRVTISGQLKTMQFTNPHIHYTIDVRDKSGKVTTWDLSGPAPGAWRDAGWNKSDFVIGEQITVTGFPKRTDPHHISTNVVKTQRGKVYGKEQAL